MQLTKEPEWSKPNNTQMDVVSKQISCVQVEDRKSAENGYSLRADHIADTLKKVK